MNKSKKSLIITVVVIIIFAILGAYSYKEYSDKEEKEKLVKEINELNGLVSKQNMDMDKVNEILDRTVTNKSYSDVERASKDYLKNSVNLLNDLMGVMSNEDIVKILTVENYKKDGPKFTNSKNLIDDTKKSLGEQKDKFLACLDEKEIDKYADEKGFNEEKKKLFKELMIGKNSSIEKDRKQFEEAIDMVLDLLNKQEEIIDFLIENKGQWEISGSQITFRDSKLVTKYNNLLTKLQAD